MLTLGSLPKSFNAAAPVQQGLGQPCTGATGTPGRRSSQTAAQLVRVPPWGSRSMEGLPIINRHPQAAGLACLGDATQARERRGKPYFQLCISTSEQTFRAAEESRLTPPTGAQITDRNAGGTSRDQSELVSLEVGSSVFDSVARAGLGDCSCLTQSCIISQDRCSGDCRGHRAPRNLTTAR